MHRGNVFAAVVAVLVLVGCNGGSERPPADRGTSPGLMASGDTASVLQTSGDTVRAAHVRMGVVCANGHVDVRIRGWTVVVPRGAEVKWHLAAGGPARVRIEPKSPRDTSWGLDGKLPLDVSAGDSIMGGRAQKEGTWRYNLVYECQLGDSTYRGLIDPEIIIVPGTRLAEPEQ